LLNWDDDPFFSAASATRVIKANASEKSLNSEFPVERVGFFLPTYERVLIIAAKPGPVQAGLKDEMSLF